MRKCKVITSAEEIARIIENSGLEYFGIRSDKSGFSVGHVFDDSCQWFQDWQYDAWGDMPDDYNGDPEHPYNEYLGCWYDGDLGGVCTVGLDNYDLSASAIEKTVEEAKKYYGDALYLVGGKRAIYGNDPGELIIESGECLAVVAENGEQ